MSAAAVSGRSREKVMALLRYAARGKVVDEVVGNGSE